MNSADEEAVSLFIDGKIGFTDISYLVAEAAKRAKGRDIIPSPSLDDIDEADAEARRIVLELAAG